MDDTKRQAAIEWAMQRALAPCLAETPLGEYVSALVSEDLARQGRAQPRDALDCTLLEMPTAEEIAALLRHADDGGDPAQDLLRHTRADAGEENGRFTESVVRAYQSFVSKSNLGLKEE